MTCCPDCGQDLAKPAHPMFYLGKHAVWCAYCEGCHDADLRATIQAENESTRDAGELLAHFTP